VSGEIVAGELVVLACQRHLSDLTDGHKRGLWFDPVAAARVFGFFVDVLTVEVEEINEWGELESKAVPFHLAPWEQFIIGSLFGWKRKDGIRRFRRAYCEIGKSNGKSAIAAGIGIYMLVADGKLRAEVYAAAAQRDQAMVVFRDAVAMWRRNKGLTKVVLPSGQRDPWQLTYLEKSSFFKPLSSENLGRSGIRVHCGLIDEIHEHRNNQVVELLRAGTKGNQQALIFEITNSGFDRNSVCWHEHDYSSKIMHGELENDSWFAYVCQCDDGDDPFEDEGCWVKANPNLGISLQPEYIREQVNEARGMPSKEASVRRLNFCQWTDAEHAWLTERVWGPCVQPLDIEAYAGMRCYGGIDLSSKLDLTALALVFPMGDVEVKTDEGVLMRPAFDVFTWFWLPKGGALTAEKRDGVPYFQWAQEGHITLSPGNVLDYTGLADILADMDRKFDIQKIAFDIHKMSDLQTKLDERGLELDMVPHSQGFMRVKDSSLWMHESIQQVEAGIHEGRIRVSSNKVLNWNVASVMIVEDAAKNRKFEKKRATGRIDGAVAMTMALGVATAHFEKPFDLDAYLKDVVIVRPGSNLRQ